MESQLNYKGYGCDLGLFCFGELLSNNVNESAWDNIVDLIEQAIVCGDIESNWDDEHTTDPFKWNIPYNAFDWKLLAYIPNIPAVKLNDSKCATTILSQTQANRLIFNRIKEALQYVYDNADHDRWCLDGLDLSDNSAFLKQLWHEVQDHVTYNNFGWEDWI